MRLVAVLVAGAASILPMAAVQAQDVDPMVRILGEPVRAAAIADAVGDCVAQDGNVDRLVRIGWARDAGSAITPEMTVHRRNAKGPLLALPVVDNPLRCWIMAQPADDRAMVVGAIDTRLGIPATESASPGWRIGNHSITFDWFSEPGRPTMTRVEVYKIPQESQ